MSLNLDKSGWERVSFGDIVHNANVTVKDPVAHGIDRVIAMEHLTPGELKIDHWGDTAKGTTFTRQVRPGQTLFGKRRAYQRKVAYAEFDAICSGDIYTFEADETLILGEFLPFIVQSEPFFDHALGTSAGSLSPRTNWRDLANFEFDLPPLDVQKRIADLLWAIERHRLHLDALANALRTAASSLIDDLRRSNYAFKHVKDVATVRNGQNYPKSLQDGRTGGVPFFKVADLDKPGNERFLTNPGGWVTADDVINLSAQILPKGTIVTARVGAAIKLERRRALAVPGLVDENHLVIQPFDVDSDYLLAVLSETALARSGNDGVVPSLNQKIVGSVAFPALPVALERRIGSAYRRLGDARDDIHTEQQTLRSLRWALLENVLGDN